MEVNKRGQAGPYIFLVVLVFAIAFIVMNFDEIKEKIAGKEEVVEEIHEEAPAVIEARTLDVFRLKNEIINLIRKERELNNRNIKITTPPILNDEAQKHSDEMSSNIYLNELNLNAEKIKKRLFEQDEESFNFEFIEEGIVSLTLEQNFNQQNTAKRLFDLFNSNQRYRNLIINNSFDLIGIGISFNKDYYDIYASLIFGIIKKEGCGYSKRTCCFERTDYFCYDPLDCSYRLECVPELTEKNKEKIMRENLISIEFTQKNLESKEVKNYRNIDKINNKLKIHCDKANDAYGGYISSLNKPYTERLSDIEFDGRHYGKCDFLKLMKECYSDLNINLDYQNSLLSAYGGILSNSKINTARASSEINNKKIDASERINSYTREAEKSYCIGF